jgi:hypothetical protein
VPWVASTRRLCSSRAAASASGGFSGNKRCSRIGTDNRQNETPAFRSHEKT